MKEKNERAKAIGKRLTELRGCRTKIGVSKEIGLPYSTLCSYEYGFRIPPDPIKELFAKYYGVSVSDIFFPEDKA